MSETFDIPTLSSNPLLEELRQILAKEQAAEDREEEAEERP
ncbi:hypothetical protein [Microvirga aerophila]|nr:hypothetical protein [Microvirga aerophila]